MMSHAKNESREVGLSTSAQEWGVLAEYEQSEVVYKLLKCISDTCLRHGHLRVMEREDFMCYGVHSHGCTSARRLLLYGRVRYSHREALLSLVRRLRLYSVSDLETLVTPALQAGELVPHLLLDPLAPSLHVTAYVLWHRVYCAMKCGIFHVLILQQQKMKGRLHALVGETSDTFFTNKKIQHKGSGALGNSAASFVKSNTSGKTDTLRFYTQEFSHLFSDDTHEASEGGDTNSFHGSSALSDFMTAIKESRVSLASIAATVPSVFVVWSYRYPRCLEWLEEHLFNDKHLQEMLGNTGLTARFAVLMDKDPWLSFVSEHSEVLPRPLKKEAFRINLLKSLSKRAQIVLLNVDEEAAEARATFERLEKKLGGWKSPEIDMLSLWCGSEGLQSEFATLFHVESLPFIVDTRPGGCDRSVKGVGQRKRRTLSDLRPVIVRSTRETIALGKDIYGIANTPKSHRMVGRVTVPAGIFSRGEWWHNIAAPERAQIVDRLSKYFMQHRLPLCFTATVEREFVIRNPYTNEPWRALDCVTSSSLKVEGECVSAQDLIPVATELRRIHRLEGFEFNVKIIEPSAPLVLSLEKTTVLSRLQAMTHMVTCANCQVSVNVDRKAHVRCLHCSPKDRSSILCETCAFTALCHASHHILLRIPAGTWAPSLQLMWGPSNVVPFSLFLGKLVSNRTGVHCGVYCDNCTTMITGTRWKCAQCYQYDLCDSCASASGKLSSSTNTRSNTSTNADTFPTTISSSASKSQRAVEITSLGYHDPTHPMLFIPYTQGADPNGILRPTCSGDLAEWLSTL